MASLSQLVTGFHGTSAAAASEILKEGFFVSHNDYDWLGTGVYFFQDAPIRAQAWAEGRFGPAATVVAADIDLGGCMDFLDTVWQVRLAAAYQGYRSRAERLGLELPRQTRGAHRLDAAIIDLLVNVLAERGDRIRSVRSAFAEGEQVFEGSALSVGTHVQIAVRDLSNNQKNVGGTAMTEHPAVRAAEILNHYFETVTDEEFIQGVKDVAARAADVEAASLARRADYAGTIPARKVKAPRRTARSA